MRTLRMGRARRDRGMALIVGLILLALMTVMALTSFNIGRTSMDIVGNLQRHNEVVNSAQSAIEEALSTTRMFAAPGSIFLTPCNNVANSRCYDLNNDGVNDVTVTLSPTPTCLESQVIPVRLLDKTSDTDLKCLVDNHDPNSIDTAQEDSLCANSIWELKAIAVDAVSEASVTVTQGAAIRVRTKDITGC